MWNEETDLTASKIERNVFNDSKERKHARSNGLFLNFEIKIEQNVTRSIRRLFNTSLERG